MDARQASPDAPGLWWRDGRVGEPVLFEVGHNLSRAWRATGITEFRDTAPRDGVTWVRCVPPDDAEVTALRARVEALESALREVCEAHRAEMIGPPGHAGAACDWCYPGGGAARVWPCESAECPIGRAFAALRSAATAIRALPLPGDATAADEVTP